jgi:hypothetical protein
MSGRLPSFSSSSVHSHSYSLSHSHAQGANALGLERDSVRSGGTLNGAGDSSIGGDPGPASVSGASQILIASIVQRFVNRVSGQAVVLGAARPRRSKRHCGRLGKRASGKGGLRGP